MQLRMFEKKRTERTCAARRRALARTALIAAALLLVMFSASFGAGFGGLGGQAAAASTDYTTGSYDIRTTVDEDHTMHVSETIKVDFGTSPHHGIYRYIPYTERQYKVVVKDTGRDNYDTETTSESGVDFLVVRIGDEDETITGKHTYRIRYELICYEDEHADYDLLSYNLFPTGWETSVGHVRSTLTLPKDIDWDRLEFHGGAQGSTGALPSFFSSSVNADTRTITLTGSHVPAETGATVAAKLPQGYWVDPPSRSGAGVVLLVLMILLPVITLLLWFFFGRDPRIVQTVEFNPPEGITPCEVGYIIDGSVDDRDVVSMLMYYANQGYISIEEEDPNPDSGKKKKKTQLFAVKEKEIGENESEYSRYLFQKLFRKGDRVDLQHLPKGFGDDMLETKNKVKAHFSEPEYAVYDGRSKVCRGLSYILVIVLTCGALALGAYYNYTTWEWLIGIVAVALIIFGLVKLNKAFDRVSGSSRKRTTSRVIAGVLFTAAGALIAMACIGSWLDSAAMGALYLAAVAVMIVFSILMRARTKRGAEMMGRILGFKNFIKTAEYDRLKMLSDENPEYFFNVLPYAYVFGIDKTWAKKFDKIRIPRPSWYNGSYDRGMGMTYTALWYTSMLASCTQGMASEIHRAAAANAAGAIADAAGGGFSGGVSGGGFGGGGGGAW
ncbi:MAG: DUF2207 domain-containing protein [Anaerovoracaceae bacterium]|jgi:general stress protein CsbA